MIIDRIRASVIESDSIVECDVTFEDTRRGQAQRIFACTESPHVLTADPNGFLIGAYLPAWAAGESRIRVDGEVCPLLAANLTIAAATLRSWYADLGPPPVIEADRGYRPPGARCAAFFSGGVDSLAMIQGLTARRAPGHPDRPTAAVVVDYQHMGGIDRRETDARFSRSLSTSRDICGSVGIDAIPVRSNFCALAPDMRFWMYRYHGSFLASMAHFLSADFRLFHIASSYPSTHLQPWGSHPQLDPYLSSQHVRIAHDGIELSRLQKVETLCDWAAALDKMYVCTSNTSNGENCGTCEKCVRTRVHLLVLGVLTKSAAFVGSDVSAEEVARLRLRSNYARICFEEALPGLRRIGRMDLAAAVENIVVAYDRSQMPGAALRRKAGRIARRVRRLVGR